MANSMLDWILQQANQSITKEEFARIRRYGTEEELREAVERMEAAGGYECLA